MHSQVLFVGSQYSMRGVDPVQRTLSPGHRTLSSESSVCSLLGAKSYLPGSLPASSSASPTSSISSWLGESTIKTSSRSSDSEANLNDRLRSIARSISDNGLPSPGMHWTSSRRKSTIPQRYSATTTPVAVQHNRRYDDLTRHIVNLRCGPCSNTPSFYPPSETLLSPLSCPSAQCALRRDFATPLEVMHSGRRCYPSFYPENGSSVSASSAAENPRTATCDARPAIPSIAGNSFASSRFCGGTVTC